MVRIQIERGLNFRKILYSWPVVLILAVIMATVGAKTFRSWQNYRIIAKEYEKLQEKAAEVEKNKKEAEESLALLNDEYGRDRIIREQFEMQKKDEKVIIILDKDGRGQTDPEIQDSQSIFYRIKNFIINIFSRG